MIQIGQFDCFAVVSIQTHNGAETQFEVGKITAVEYIAVICTS